jgi:hypothetical protein
LAIIISKTKTIKHHTEVALGIHKKNPNDVYGVANALNVKVILEYALL